MEAGVVQFKVMKEPQMVGQMQVAEFTSIIVVLGIVATLIVIAVSLYRRQTPKRTQINITRC